ncbi:MAG: radical SAM protein [Deltaproteobacteria bacterium]|nr:radical SAM protein [Deltaproteobacteria bacterium]MBW2139973.1 radical SAM protein [Deltaproteobacteria bacterium]MBW2322318.1 radical SAM protein [Deltaproteobacteria bacterium]
MTPFIIPFFLSHQGCPHRCLYCNQHQSGGRRAEPLTSPGVTRGVEAGLSSSRLQPGASVEVAFYGGTFTALSRDRQSALLGAVAPFLKRNLVQGIRLSTRPDALPCDEVEFLESMGVTTIEIGAQSMDDKVLEMSRRGHTALDTREAAQRIKTAGLKLGLQLLPGLPGENQASLESTLQGILDLSPDEVRLYPALVIKGTPLAKLYQRGEYRPLTLEQAVEICAWMFKSLTRAGITVTRIGLQTSSELTQGLMAGPHHPSLGHLVKAEIFYRAIASSLQIKPARGSDVTLFVAPRDVSQAQGHARSNLSRLSRDFGNLKIKIKPDPDQPRGLFRWQGEMFSVI